MNLDNNPTPDELRELLRPLDDRAAHHVLWVDRGGEVHVTPMAVNGKIRPAPKTPGPDVLANAMVYFEPFWAGNGYVGPEGVADDEWMTQALEWLLRDWAAAKRQGSPAKMIQV